MSIDTRGMPPQLLSMLRQLGRLTLPCVRCGENEHVTQGAGGVVVSDGITCAKTQRACRCGHVETSITPMLVRVAS